MEQTKNNPDQEKKTRPNTISFVTNALLGTILVLLVCNLSATGYLIFKSQQQTASGETAPSTEPLPAELDSAEGKEALFERFREPFNNKDDDQLYTLLDPLVRTEVTREKFDEQMPLIYQIGGTITNGVYSHYDYQGTSRGRKVFILHYVIETNNGAATLDITIAQADQEPYTIWGFHINKQ